MTVAIPIRATSWCRRWLSDDVRSQVQAAVENVPNVASVELIARSPDGPFWAFLHDEKGRITSEPHRLGVHGVGLTIPTAVWKAIAALPKEEEA